MYPWLDIAFDATSTDRMQSVRDTSLAALVREDVLGAILCGELKAGQRINEPDVALRLKVSRVPVREALRELQSTGLVVARKNAGVFVRQHTVQEIQELYDLRALLDGYAGQQAALHANAQTIAALKASIQAMKQAVKASQVQAYYAENLRFHALIVRAANNSKLSDMYRSLVQQLHLSRLESLSHMHGMQASVVEHSDIVKAIAARDGAAAFTLMSAHVHQALARRPALPPHPAT